MKIYIASLLEFPVQSILVTEGCPWLKSLLVNIAMQPSKIMHIYEYCQTITAAGSAHMNIKQSSMLIKMSATHNMVDRQK